jgi:exportin-5
MAALPTDGPSFSVFSPTLEALLNQLVAVDFRAPLSNAQVAKLLETFGKFARARPELAATIMSRMFTILNELPADATSGAPPVRQRDIIASGRTGQAARQKVCAAILIVCSAAPMVR